MTSRGSFVILGTTHTFCPIVVSPPVTLYDGDVVTEGTVLTESQSSFKNTPFPFYSGVINGDYGVPDRQELCPFRDSGVSGT